MKNKEELIKKIEDAIEYGCSISVLSPEISGLIDILIDIKKDVEEFK